MSYRLIRNAAVKSCTAKIFGIGCFAKTYCCLCQRALQSNINLHFSQCSEGEGREQNKFSKSLPENIHLIRPPACTLHLQVEKNVLALAAIGITQEQVVLHLLKQLQIHKFTKGRNVQNQQEHSALPCYK